MEKTTQPPAGMNPTKNRVTLQRGVALLWSLIGTIVAFVTKRSRRRAPLALPPPAPSDGPELATLVDETRRPRRTFSKDRMYSSLIVDDLIDKLRRQNAQMAFLTSVFKSTSDAVVVADLTGKITMFNKGAETVFELEQDMAIGDNLFRLCTESTPDGPVISRLLVENKRIENLRSELVGVSGKRTQVLLTVNFVEDEGGVPVAIVAVIKDNSQLEKLLSEVTQKKEEVERLFQEVEKLSVTDEKTGLYNSRYFQRSISDEYERMKRGHMDELSLIVIDIDHFKRFNDTYGHQTGDDVLKAVADVLKRTVRKIDVPCRFGGEEFMVILPSTGRVGAHALAERIRTAVAEVKVPVGKASKGSTGSNRPPSSHVSVTVSLGVRTHGRTDTTVGMFIHEADEAMYRAKQSGRNRTCAFESVAA